MVLIAALALSNFPEALSGTVGLRHASRSTLYVLLLWGMIALLSAITTAAAFSALGDIGNATSAGLMAYAAGSLIAMVTETMVPEAFHNGPRYSGVLAAAGFAALMMLAGLFS